MTDLEDATERLAQLMGIARKLGRNPSPATALSMLEDVAPHKPEHSVRAFFLAQQAVLENIREPEDEWSRDEQVSMSQLWAALQRARLFDIHPEHYRRLYDSTKLDLAETVKKLETAKSRTTLTWENVSAEMKRAADDAAEFPDPLPFDAVALFYGAGFPLSAPEYQVRFNASEDDVLVSWVMGHIITSSGWAWEILLVGDVDPAEPPTLEVITVCAPSLEGWSPAASIATIPWVLDSLIDYINAHRTLVVERRTTARREAKLARKARLRIPRVIPPPFYSVPLRHELVTEHIDARGPGRTVQSPQHRYDVRGHERCRIKRGPLPIPPETEVQLRKRGYRVYLGALDDKGARIVAERPIRPKSPAEWMAIKSTWVAPYVKGPEGAPYIPSTRTVGSA